MHATNANRTKAVFVAGDDPTNVKTWSGTPSYMLSALRKDYDFVHIEKQPFTDFSRSLVRVVRKLSKGKVNLMWNSHFARWATNGARKRILAANADIVFAAANSTLINVLEGDVPVISISDATAPAMMRYYNSFDNLSPSYRQRAIATDKGGIDRSILALYPSSWAAQSALDDHLIDARKVAVCSWGINMDADRPSPRLRGKPAPDILKLLFVGVDWQRKGGNIAIEAVKQLTDRGIPCELHIVGVERTVYSSDIPDNVTFYGRLSKNDPQQDQKLHQLFDGCDVYFMPTLAEAWGMVFAEAAAYGMPTISYATGGVTSVVNAQTAGILLPEKSTASDFANAIETLVKTPGMLQKLSEGAMKESKERLNWNSWVSQLSTYIDKALAANPR